MPTGVQQGDILVGKYRVERILGSGGMGIIVAAHHLRLDQRVAIKFLAPDAFSDPGALVRFDREARAAAKIKSPHVAQVTDVGTLEDGTPYLVMEYLEGEDLAALLRREGSLPVAEAVDLVLQACEGIGEAHRLGVVHRDIKPANLFCLRQPDGSRWLKVLDFGISKLTNLAPTTRGMAATGASAMMGSPFYMSPEQMQSPRTVDERTDIWGLGIVLYELLAGDVPFKGGNLPEVCLNVTTQPPHPLHHLRPDAPPALQRVIFRCLEKDLTKRFSSVAELAEALLPFASGRAWSPFPTRHPSAGPQPSTLSLRPMPQAGPSSSPSLPDSSWGHTKKRLTAARARSRAWGFAAVLVSMVGIGSVAWWKGEPWLRSMAPARTDEREGSGPAPIVASTAQNSPSVPLTSTAPRPEPPRPSEGERREATVLSPPSVERPGVTHRPNIATRPASPVVPRAAPTRNPATPPEAAEHTASNTGESAPASNPPSPSPPAPHRGESSAGGASPSCTLIITSVPPCEVLLDGVALGATPLFGVAASAGMPHTVTFIHAKEGTRVSTVSCRPDEVKQVAGRFEKTVVRPGLDPNPYH